MEINSLSPLGTSNEKQVYALKRESHLCQIESFIAKNLFIHPRNALSDKLNVAFWKFRDIMKISFYRKSKTCIRERGTESGAQSVHKDLEMIDQKNDLSILPVKCPEVAPDDGSNDHRLQLPKRSTP